MVNSHASTQCGKHNKEVNQVHTVHSTSIQYLIPLLLIYCCLLDHAREGIIFTVDYNILLEEVPILTSCWYSLALEGPVRIACLQGTYASQPVSVLKQQYSHQMPFEMHCLGEVHHTRFHVSNTTQTVTNVPTTNTCACEMVGKL